jgi:hypothetical protein
MKSVSTQAQEEIAPIGSKLYLLRNLVTMFWTSASICASFSPILEYPKSPESHALPLIVTFAQFQDNQQIGSLTYCDDTPNHMVTIFNGTLLSSFAQRWRSVKLPQHKSVNPLLLCIQQAAK